MVTVEFAGEVRRPPVLLHETNGEVVTGVRNTARKGTDATGVREGVVGERNSEKTVVDTADSGERIKRPGGVVRRERRGK